MSHWESIGKSNEWYTPKYVFDALGFLFDMDVASPLDRRFCHVPAREFITKNSLQKEWYGTVWMNPPFGGRNGLIAWIDKMNSHQNGIALTPDRTSADWWYQAATGCDAILHVRGKIKFIGSDGILGEHPSNGTTLFAWGEKATIALLRAEKNGLGIFTTKKI